jgi:hypothetical protein
VERLVFVGRQAVVGAAGVELAVVFDPQLLGEPDDAFGLRQAQVVDGQHGGALSVTLFRMGA